MQGQSPTDLFPSLFSRTAPLDIIETENADGRTVSILPVAGMRAHFKTAINIVSEIEDSIRFGRTTQSMAIALYPALEGLFDGIVNWCTLQNIEAYANRLPEIHPAVNVDAPTLHRIILSDGPMRREMFGETAPFPNIMGFPKNHKPYDNLIKPLRLSGALDITQQQSKALGASMQSLLDLSYIGRGSISHHGFPIGRKFIRTWDDVNESTFTDFVVPAMRAIVATTVSAVKKNKNLAIPKAWLPRAETPPMKTFDRNAALTAELAESLREPDADAARYVASLIDSITGGAEERDRFILEIIERESDDDTPAF